MNLEKTLNRISMICLIVGGIFFIVEGAILVKMKNDNPSQYPQKLSVAGGLTIALGCLSIIFAVLHLFMSPEGKELFAGLKAGMALGKKNAGTNANTSIKINASANTKPSV
jgi:hypothetical protein